MLDEQQEKRGQGERREQVQALMRKQGVRDGNWRSVRHRKFSTDLQEGLDRLQIELQKSRRQAERRTSQMALLSRQITNDAVSEEDSGVGELCGVFSSIDCQYNSPFCSRMVNVDSNGRKASALSYKLQDPCSSRKVSVDSTFRSLSAGLQRACAQTPANRKLSTDGSYLAGSSRKSSVTCTVPGTTARRLSVNEPEFQRNRMCSATAHAQQSQRPPTASQSNSDDIPTVVVTSVDDELDGTTNPDLMDETQLKIYNFVQSCEEKTPPQTDRQTQRRHSRVYAQPFPRSRRVSCSTSVALTNDDVIAEEADPPLRLPPIVLPPIYLRRDIPVLKTNFEANPGVVKVEGTLQKRPKIDWADLKQCRYLRRRNKN